jgi:hypothetical protein
MEKNEYMWWRMMQKKSRDNSIFLTAGLAVVLQGGGFTVVVRVLG